MKRLIMMCAAIWPAFSLGLILLPTLGFAEAHHFDTIPRAKQIALPQLSDGLGWKQPMYYSTIQTADIDGDGQTEVLARWIDGLNIYRFENGTLLRHSRITALSDNAGFYEPSWYSTIRTAVLDAKVGQADVIAREHDGIHVFRYDSKKHEWRELGAHASVRPFADTDASGTDWTKPEHYLTIQLADLTADGVAELVGRGHNGMQTWRWDPAAESWAQLSSGGPLPDDYGFNQEPYYHSIQLIDVDRDGVAELLARAPAGVQTYKWSGGGWTMISAGGPFGDDAGFLAGKRYKSVRASVDATGRAWLYGLTAGTAGAGSGSIQIHRWEEDHWQRVQTIPLPGFGWDRENQFATLLAADIQGNAEPEFLVRGPGGLHAYSLEGSPLPMHSQSFTDAQGWNLTEQYGTLHTALARLTENHESHTRTLIVGRGSKGLEVYKFTRQWAAAADSNFPQYCTNFINDSSPECLAYKAISNAALVGVFDIRSKYTEASYHKEGWRTFQTTVSKMSNPIGSQNLAIWNTVQSEMVQELGYVATVRGWFDHNLEVLKNNYDASHNLLGQAESDVDLDNSNTVVSKWLEFAGDVVSGIAGFFDAGGTAISLVITVLEGTYSELSASAGDIQEQIDQIKTDLNNQENNAKSTNISDETGYLTDYSKLQQIGKDPLTGGYDWADATLDAKQNAELGGQYGMLINFYRALIPYRWTVWWCDNNGNVGGGPECGSIYTPDMYNCLYGPSPSVLWPYSSNAYVYAGYFHSVNWDLLGRLTGPLTPGTQNLNAIWYMMLLGADLGWDLPQVGQLSSGYVYYSDPHLAYNNIKYGYNGPGTANAACNGNGSTTGILSSNQTLSQRLFIAQQNSRHITASEAKGILEEIHALALTAKNASPNRDVEIDLTSPLREAARLIERAKLQTHSGQEGSVSATTPTHLLELFIRRAQDDRPDLGERQAEYLAAKAYSLIAALEGQNSSCAPCWCSICAP